MRRNRKQKVNDDEQSAETQMEGISSAHSWIKSNTMLRPTKLGKKKDEMSFDDVSYTIVES